MVPVSRRRSSLPVPASSASDEMPEPPLVVEEQAAPDTYFGRVLSEAQTQAGAPNDALQVAAAVKAGPVQGATALTDLLTQHPDPAYQLALLDAATPALEALSATIVQGQDEAEGESQRALDLLFASSQMLAPEVATALARPLANALRGEDSGVSPPALSTALEHLRSSGQGVRLAQPLSAALDAQGQPLLADAVTRGSNATLLDATEALHSTKAAVDTLNAEAQALAADLSQAGYTSEQLAAALDGFRSSHPEYQAYADASARAAALMDDAAALLSSDNPAASNPSTPEGVAKAQAQALLQALPELAQSPAGNALFAEATLRSAAGEATFLDVLPAVAEATSDATAYLDAVSAAVVDGVGTQVVELQSQGDTAGAKAALTALGAQASILRVDVNTLSAAVKALSSFDAKGEAGLRGFAEGVGRALKALGASGPAAEKLAVRLGGLGTTLGLLGTVAGISGWEDATDAQRLATLTTGLGTGLQGAKFAADVVKGSQFASAEGIAQAAANISRFGAKAVPLLTALTAGINAAGELSAGKWDEAAADLAVSSGTLLALFAPGPGTVVGGGLIAAGTLYKLGKSFFGPEGDEAQMMDTRAALITLGVPPDKAQTLNDLEHGRHFIGEFIGAQAARLGIPPQDYLTYLVALPEADLMKVVEVARQVPVDAAGRLTLDVPARNSNAPASIPLNPSELNGRLDLSEVKSVADAEAYLRELGLLPGLPPPTEAQPPAPETPVVATGPVPTPPA